MKLKQRQLLLKNRSPRKKKWTHMTKQEMKMLKRNSAITKTKQSVLSASKSVLRELNEEKQGWQQQLQKPIRRKDKHSQLKDHPGLQKSKLIITIKILTPKHKSRLRTASTCSLSPTNTWSWGYQIQTILRNHWRKKNIKANLIVNLASTFTLITKTTWCKTW